MHAPHGNHLRPRAAARTPVARFLIKRVGEGPLPSAGSRGRFGGPAPGSGFSPGTSHPNLSHCLCPGSCYLDPGLAWSRSCRMCCGRRGAGAACDLRAMQLLLTAVHQTPTAHRSGDSSSPVHTTLPHARRPRRHRRGSGRLRLLLPADNWGRSTHRRRPLAVGDGGDPHRILHVDSQEPTATDILQRILSRTNLPVSATTVRAQREQAAVRARALSPGQDYGRVPAGRGPQPPAR
jgi:hypothetical protein